MTKILVRFDLDLDTKNLVNITGNIYQILHHYPSLLTISYDIPPAHLLRRLLRTIRPSKHVRKSIWCVLRAHGRHDDARSCGIRSYHDHHRQF